MTVLEFADCLDIKASLVSRIENDMLKPTKNILNNISDVLTLTKEEYDTFYELSKIKQTITTELKILY